MADDGFEGFPKIARLSREIVVTEKIDGTNAQIFFNDDGRMFVGSRTRWLTRDFDNFGFFRWAEENEAELSKLGPGRHFGEWWGSGIQRTYGLKEKRFSLFNVKRWGDAADRPACCSVVPVLFRGLFDEFQPNEMLRLLSEKGSVAAPGFMKPEGFIVFHVAAGVGFKKTLEKDSEPKGLALAAAASEARR